MNLTYAKDFPWKKMAHIRRISKRIFFWMIATSATLQNWGKKRKKKPWFRCGEFNDFKKLEKIFKNHKFREFF
jgi:hypothetical protein